MNGLEILVQRRAELKSKINKLAFDKSDRDRAFDRLATAMKRGSVPSLTEADIAHAKAAAEVIGGTTQQLVSYFCSPTKMERSEVFNDVTEIVRAHQKGVGAILSGVSKKRNSMNAASAGLARIIRKAKNPGDRAKVLANLPTRFTEKDLKGGGRNKVRQQKEAAPKKGFKRN